MPEKPWTIRFEGYLPVDEGMAERLKRICADIEKIPTSAMEIDQEARVITIDCAQVKDWLKASQDAIRTVRAGEHVVVKPPWEDFEPQTGDLVLEIDPGTSFGSGLHESTRLCLQALERYAKPGQVVVDFGTGTGILAIAAAKLGVSHVTAIEANPEAVEVARANVKRNGLESVIEVHHALSPDFVCEPVDLVIANITAETITAHLPALVRVLTTGGLLVASGMTKLNSPDVERLLPDAGFGIVEKLIEGRWVALMAIKQ